MKKTIVFLIFCIFFASCGSGRQESTEYYKKDSFASQQESMDLEELENDDENSAEKENKDNSQQSSYIQQGMQAMDQKNFQKAFWHFHSYTKEKPQDPLGYLWCGKMLYKLEKYKDSMTYLYNASLLRKKTPIRHPAPSLSKAILDCAFGSYEKPLRGISSSENDERSSIESCFRSFSQAIPPRDWDTIAKYASFSELMQSIGEIPVSKEETNRTIEKYFTTVMSPSFSSYIQQARIANIVSSEETARIDIEGYGERDNVYLKKIQGQWKIAAFLPNAWKKIESARNSDKQEMAKIVGSIRCFQQALLQKDQTKIQRIASFPHFASFWGIAKEQEPNFIKQFLFPLLFRQDIREGFSQLVCREIIIRENIAIVRLIAPQGKRVETFTLKKEGESWVIINIFGI